MSQRSEITLGKPYQTLNGHCSDAAQIYSFLLHENPEIFENYYKRLIRLMENPIEKSIIEILTQKRDFQLMNQTEKERFKRKLLKNRVEGMQEIFNYSIFLKLTYFYIYFHDVGKLTTKFQKYIYSKRLKNNSVKSGGSHAYPSYYLIYQEILDPLIINYKKKKNTNYT